MTFKVFQRILEEGQRAGINEITTQATTWYRNKASKVNITPTSIIRTAPNTINKISDLIGQMMLFNYDPLHKDTLPYYDKFPLVFPVDVKSDRFTAINMHYLPLNYRAQLMDALYQISTVDEGQQRISLSYDLLARFSATKMFRPCFKCYLNTQVKSRFVLLDGNEWDIALFLPLERFAKKNKRYVHTDSVKKVANG